MKSFLKILLIILMMGGLITIGNYVISPILQKNFNIAQFKDNLAPILDKSKAVFLQEVNNLGYTFYVGQIDNPNVTIGDDLKTEITKIVYNAKFSKKILKTIPIIIINSLALKDGLYISTPKGNLPVMKFGPDFLYEGGVYATYTGGGTIIYINKTILDKGLLTDVLTHELGHAVGSRLTEADWIKYYGLRNIQTGTSRSGELWNLSPQEDFAEVYKNTFTNLAVKTYYGSLLPSYGYDAIFENTCRTIYTKIYETNIAAYEKINPPKDCSKEEKGYMQMMCGWNSTAPYTTDAQKTLAKDNANTNGEVQSCRREVMTHPEKYPDDFKMGVPYKSTVGPKTKEFIIEIANKADITIQETSSIKNNCSDLIQQKNKTYFIRKGDSLSSVAKMFGVSTSTIACVNNFKNNALKIGDEIIIPLKN